MEQTKASGIIEIREGDKGEKQTFSPGQEATNQKVTVHLGKLCKFNYIA